MKLIDKDVLTEKLWERRTKHRDFGGSPYSEYGHEDDEILSLINSLEVKEVDLETSIDDYINLHFTEGCDGGMISDWYKVLGGVHYKDLKEIAKHFFELGMVVSNKAQKGEEV